MFFFIYNKPITEPIRNQEIDSISPPTKKITSEPAAAAVFFLSYRRRAMLNAQPLILPNVYIVIVKFSENFLGSFAFISPAFLREPFAGSLSCLVP